MGTYKGNAQDASQDIASALMAIPAADVKLVVRGRWIDEADADDLFVYHKCSICGKVFSNAQLAVLHYCPNCGAYMIGGNYDIF